MAFWLELFPIVLFFGAYKWFDLYVATAVLLAAVSLQSLISYCRHKTLPTTQWVSLIMILVFGGMTLYFRNEAFIKYKPSVVYVLFALMIAGYVKLRQAPAMKTLMGAHLTLPAAMWQRLDWLWAGFFLMLAGLNAVIAALCPTDWWVNFKLFGMMGLTILFVIGQSVWLYPHQSTQESPND